MYVVMEIGRMAGAVVDTPFHVAQSGIMNGTMRKATDAEIVAANLEVVVEAPPVANDFGLPVGYRVEPTEGGGYDLFDPGGIRLNTLPIANLAAARSLAVDSVGMHIVEFLPVEESLTREVMDSQIAQRPVRTYTIEDYMAQEVEGGFNVVDPGGIKINEEPLTDIAACKALAAQHLALMIEQGEVPGPDGQEADNGDDREIVVPADWETMHHMKIKALARLIGGEEPADLAAAKATITDYNRRMAGAA